MLRSAVQTLRQRGPAEVLRRAVARSSRVVFRSYTAVLYRSTTLDLPGPPPPAELKVDLVSFDDLTAARHFKVLSHPTLIKQRYADGHLCIGVRIGETLAHTSWLTVGRLPIDPGIPDLVAPGLGGAYDGFTFPQFRGRGCLTYAVREICRHAEQAGLTRVVGAIHPGNRASISVFERLLFERVGLLTFRKVLWRRQFDHPTL